MGLLAFAEDRGLVCVMIDLDYFKNINDQHGHAAGDEAIVLMSELLSGHIRPGDIICRYGGEEFCVLLPNTDEPTAYTWTEQLRQTVAATTLCVRGKTIRLTASFGIAARNAAIFRQEDLVRKADDSLRAAKLAGRNRVVSWAEVNREEDSPKLHRYAAIFQGLVARDIMTTPVTCLPTDMTVGDAAERFLRHEIDSAPIVSSDGSLAGIVSEKDIMEGLGHHEGWNALLSEIMTVRDHPLRAGHKSRVDLRVPQPRTDPSRGDCGKQSARRSCQPRQPSCAGFRTDVNIQQPGFASDEMRPNLLKTADALTSACPVDARRAERRSRTRSFAGGQRRVIDAGPIGELLRAASIPIPLARNTRAHHDQVSIKLSNDGTASIQAPVQRGSDLVGRQTGSHRNGARPIYAIRRGSPRCACARRLLQPLDARQKAQADAGDAGGRACGGNIELAVPAACAVEMIHTYSMTPRRFAVDGRRRPRRGRPTCHKKFGEGVAILAGDGSMALAFEVIAREITPAEVASRLFGHLGNRLAPTALVGGQCDDIGQELASGSRELLESIHNRKTGALFLASLRMGGLVAGALGKEADGAARVRHEPGPCLPDHRRPARHSRRPPQRRHQKEEGGLGQADLPESDRRKAKPPGSRTPGRRRLCRTDPFVQSCAACGPWQRLSPTGSSCNGHPF